MLRLAILTVASIAIASVRVVEVDAAANPYASSVKMCFLMFANVDDLGWSFSVNVGRLRAKNRLEALHPGTKFDTLTLPNMGFAYPTVEDKEAAWRFLVHEQCNVIVSIGCCYLEAMPQNRTLIEQRAAAYPNITFIMMWDNQEALESSLTLTNLVFFIVDQTSAYFLAGVAAATQAITCTGIMVPFAWNRNSHDAASGFVLGVQYVNASMPVHVVEMQSFYAPDMEILVTGLLEDRYGCEVTARYSDPRDADTFVLNRKSRGVMSIGSHSDLQQYVGDSVLVSAFSHWDEIVVPLVSDLVTFGAVQPFRLPLVYGTHTGVNGVSAVSPAAKQTVQQAVDSAAADVLATNDYVMCGPTAYTTCWGATVPIDSVTGCRQATASLPGWVVSPATYSHLGFQTPAACPNGTFASYNTDVLIELVCTVCPEDTYAIAGDQECRECPRGLHSRGNSSECIAPAQLVTALPNSNTPDYVIAILVVAGVLIVLGFVVVGRLRYAGWKKNQSAPKDPPLCILFTDVESSTQLWGSYPHAMSQAMEVHNHVIRQAVAQNNGYEVKTVGDSFMIAIGRPLDAVTLAIDIQLGLMQAEWPEEFRGNPNGIWNGLRVRIGVHQCLDVEPKYEPLHNYWDYYGNDVNVSARIESKARGGEITMLESTWRTVMNDAQFEEILGENVECYPVARNADLKGVDGNYTIYSLVPESLKDRMFPPLEGHDDDFNDDQTGDSSSTASSNAEPVSAHAVARVMQALYLNLPPPHRKPFVSLVSKSLNLAVPSNARRAVAVISSDLLTRMGGTADVDLTVNKAMPKRASPRWTPSPRTLREPQDDATPPGAMQ
jgi:class 3 adenylate cyclase/basic membrane lipoprotein Med (substrate-binding protein (PBP1-ABC) superfamily)